MTSREPSTITSLYLTPRDQGRPLTFEEFERAGAEEGYRYELINGKLEVSPLPNLSHDELVDWLKLVLARYAASHPDVLRKVKGPARVFVPERTAITAPEPDIAAYRTYLDDRPISRRRWQDISPLLVAEVISADTADKDLVRNLELYVEVPTIREYWIIDPRPDSDRPSLTVHRRRGQHWQRPVHLAAGETYTTRLLQGFALVLDPRSET